MCVISFLIFQWRHWLSVWVQGSKSALEKVEASCEQKIVNKICGKINLFIYLLKCFIIFLAVSF